MVSDDPGGCFELLGGRCFDVTHHLAHTIRGVRERLKTAQ